MNEIAPDVACLPVTITNVYFVGARGQPWALVDTGTPGSASKIQAAAEARYGAGARPQAIILTHGHFDHSGAARSLAETWDVPVYAHPLEVPFLSGRSPYPPSDPTVGGAIAFLSRAFPSKPIDLGDHLRVLPPDGTVPGLPGWEWLATPGHAPGHVALWRANDRTLLAGDACVTVNMDSFAALARKKPDVCRAPAPFNYDWDAARASASRLAALRPQTLACGHGIPLSGPSVAQGLDALARGFPIPTHGRYVAVPAVTDAGGIASLPPPVRDPLPARLGLGLGALSLAVLAVRRHRRAQK